MGGREDSSGVGEGGSRVDGLLWCGCRHGRVKCVGNAALEGIFRARVSDVRDQAAHFTPAFLHRTASASLHEHQEWR